MRSVLTFLVFFLKSVLLVLALAGSSWWVAPPDGPLSSRDAIESVLLKQSTMASLQCVRNCTNASVHVKLFTIILFCTGNQLLVTSSSHRTSALTLWKEYIDFNWCVQTDWRWRMKMDTGHWSSLPPIPCVNVDARCEWAWRSSLLCRHYYSWRLERLKWPRQEQ